MKKYYNFIALFILISTYVINVTLFAIAGEFRDVVRILLGFSVFETILYFFWKRKEIKKLIKTSLFKNFTSNIITLSLVFLILGMINYLVNKNDFVIDFTRSKIHSLSDQSKSVLSHLNSSELKMTLFSKREDWNRYLNLLKLYENESPQVTLKAIDVDQNPTLVTINEIEHNGTLLLEYEGKVYKSIIKDELGITNLLMKVLRPKKLILYYVTGHNQIDLDKQEPAGASVLKGMILGSNYDLRFLDLSQKVPSDAAGIILLNPQTSFLKKELENLYHYILKGGSLLVSLAPQFNQISLSGLEETLEKFGIKFVNGLILDRLSEGQGGQASIPIVSKYPGDHDITKKFEGRTVFPVSGFFRVLNKKMFDWKIITESTPFPASWGEMSFDEVKTGKAVYQENSDFKGPLPIMLAGEKSDSRMVVFGSSSFITNQFQGQTNNFNLFLNSLSWMVNDEALLSLDRPQLEGNLIYISDIHLTMVLYFAIICFPFIFFGIAIFAYRFKLGR